VLGFLGEPTVNVTELNSPSREGELASDHDQQRPREAPTERQRGCDERP
jgi:hypothetical protein